MTRIFSRYAYGQGPRAGCWWDETCARPDRLAFSGSLETDVAIIGAGFTGLSTAYHLACAGLKPIVLDAHDPGWGASGRNGGFCCLGGGMLEDAQLDARLGKSARLEFRAAEKAAVDLVADLIETLGLAVDQHSDGETVLAHRPKDMVALRAEASAIKENYGLAPDVIEQSDLTNLGLQGPFHGGLTIPIGFALNPLKYLVGLAAAAEAAGATLYHDSQVVSLQTQDGRHYLRTASGTIRARHVIVGTNGYSSETIPDWLGGRYVPVQSTVLVTRPLSDAELERQGWLSDQMCYDTRHLLHYFRLMPDRRFLFGMRGGLMTGPAAEARARRRVLHDFQRFFPQWAQVEISHMWSGMVCLARNRLPYVGETKPGSGIWVGLCYHGNGVAMATLSGKILADLVQQRSPEIWPKAMQLPLAKFPFGRARRLVTAPIYLAMKLSDLG